MRPWTLTRSWLGILALLPALLLCAADARAVSISVSSSASAIAANDPTPVTYEVFLHADGSDLALVDVTVQFSDVNLVGAAMPQTTGNPFLSPGASFTSPVDVLFTGSDIVSVVPTTPGEIIKMGELQVVSSGVGGTLEIVLNTSATQVFDTLSFDTTVPVTNTSFETLAVLDINPVPEPTTLGMLALGLAGLAGLRRRQPRP